MQFCVVAQLMVSLGLAQLCGAWLNLSRRARLGQRGPGGSP